MLRHITVIAALAAAIALPARESVRWSATTHNFGAFDEDAGRVSCNFTFVNTGTEPVSIIAARPSCGCTAPTFPTEAIAPGDSGTVTVTYDPAGRPGRFNKFVAVDFSFPDSRTKLYITGTVVGSAGSVEQRFPVDCGGPLKLNRNAVMFGEVDKNKMRTAFITAYNTGHDTLVPVVSSKPPYIDVQFEPEAVAPGEQTTVAFFFCSDRTPLYGLVTDSLSLSYNGGANQCAIPTVALVREDFSRLTPGQMTKAPVARLAENTLDFGTIGRGDDSISRTATISNLGKRTLEVRRVYTTDPGVEVSIDRTSIKKGKEALITVKVNPELLPGAILNARISIITNDPANPTITLRAVGEIE